MGHGRSRPQGPTWGDKIAAFGLPVLEMSWNRAVPFQNRSIPFHIRGVGTGTVERDDFRAHRNPSRAREHPHKARGATSPVSRHLCPTWHCSHLSVSIIHEHDYPCVPNNVHPWR